MNIIPFFEIEGSDDSELNFVYKYDDSLINAPDAHVFRKADEIAAVALDISLFGNKDLSK